MCDTPAHAAINTLFRPNNLRHHGITLQTIIDEPRAAVPDVPALYIISPTLDNIARLSRDLSKQPLYHRAAVCFTSPISRSLLTALAAQLSIPSPITRVHDLYSDYVSLEQNLFSLNISESYVRIKSISDDQSLAKFIQPIVSGIFSVLLTLGVIPVIRSQRGGPAEAVSLALDDMLRSNLQLFHKSSLSSRALSFRRPLLLMLDRDFDFNAILHHTWTYQALVHDCLNMHLNKLVVKSCGSDNPSNPTSTTYTLDKETDFFWAQNASTPFPSVAEAIEAALTKYRTDVEEINRKAGGRPDASQTPSLSEESGSHVGTSHLAAAIANLPELSKRKETIDVHTNIATALLDHINKRSLDTFFELEHELISESYRPVSSVSCEEYKGAVAELLKGVKETCSGEKRGQGSASDRLRLFLIFYSSFGQQLSEKDMSEFRSMLNAVGVDTSLIKYITHLKGYRHDLVIPEDSPAQGTINAAKLKGLMTNVMNRGYRSVANVAQNAKKLIVDQKRTFAVANMLELFMNEKARGRNESLASDVLEGYLLFDPKQMPSETSRLHHTTGETNENWDISGGSMDAARKMRKVVFSDAIVFTIGGGNYVEYDDCVQTMERASSVSSPKNILYGTTDLVTPEGFLEQLSRVAKKSE